MEESDRGGDGVAPSRDPGPRGPGKGGRLVAALFLVLAVAAGLLGGILLDRTLLSPPPPVRAPVGTASTAGSGGPGAGPGPADTSLATADTAFQPADTGLALADTVPGGARGAVPRGPSALPGGRVLEWMADSLKLTPEQRMRVAAVVRQERRRARALTVRVRPRYQQILRRTRLRVLAILTPEQRLQLRRLLARRRAQRRDADSAAPRPRP